MNRVPFLHLNQEQLVIYGREKMTCTGNHACAMKSVTFSLMVLLNIVQSSFLKSTIYMDYAVDIMFFSVHVVVWKVRDYLL